MNWLYLGLGAAAYLIGAIPFGHLIAKHKGVNLLQEGSGSTGATNVGRLLGIQSAVVTFLLDVLKGVVVVVGTQWLTHDPTWAVANGLIAVIGHTFSPFIEFKKLRGGKGVATTLGLLLAAQPLVGLTLFGLWGVVVVLTKYVFVASVTAALGVIAAQIWWSIDPLPVRQIFIAIAMLAIIKHVPNMVRWYRGEEKKFRFKGEKHESV